MAGPVQLSRRTLENIDGERNYDDEITIVKLHSLTSANRYNSYLESEDLTKP